MKIAPGFVALCLLMAITVQLEPANAVEQVDQVQEALDMMKAQGLDEESYKQVEGMLKGMEAKGKQMEAAKTQKEREEFERANAGHGTARVTVEGKLYELTVTSCDITNRSSGQFVIRASQPPGMDDGQLWGEWRGRRQHSVFRRDSWFV